jgi:calpain-15
VQARGLLAASISSDGEAKNAVTGLVAGHAYSLIDARKFTVKKKEVRLVQLRNPWGSFEWKGAWSDGSREWRENPKIKKLIRPAAEDDGSFWMEWGDFCRHFDGIDICNRSRGCVRPRTRLHAPSPGPEPSLNLP